MDITPGRLDVHRFFLTKTYRSSQFRNILNSLLWSLAMFVDAVRPVCSYQYCCKYFLGVTHVRTVSVSPVGLICPLSCAALVFASMTYFNISNKRKDGKAASVFKQWEKEVCRTSPCRWEWGDEECLTNVRIKCSTWESRAKTSTDAHACELRSLDICLILRIFTCLSKVCNLYIRAEVLVDHSCKLYIHNTIWVCIPACAQARHLHPEPIEAKACHIFEQIEEKNQRAEDREWGLYVSTLRHWCTYCNKNTI